MERTGDQPDCRDRVSLAQPPGRVWMHLQNLTSEHSACVCLWRTCMCVCPARTCFSVTTVESSVSWDWKPLCSVNASKPKGPLLCSEAALCRSPSHHGTAYLEVTLGTIFASGHQIRNVEHRAPSSLSNTAKASAEPLLPKDPGKLLTRKARECS